MQNHRLSQLRYLWSVSTVWKQPYPRNIWSELENAFGASTGLLAVSVFEVTVKLMLACGLIGRMISLLNKWWLMHGLGSDFISHHISIQSALPSSHEPQLAAIHHNAPCWFISKGLAETTAWTRVLDHSVEWYAQPFTICTLLVSSTSHLHFPVYVSLLSM